MAGLSPIYSLFVPQMRNLIDNLRKEAETTLRALYALKQFRKSITCPECVEKININAPFWLLYESSTRTNLFIGIRRLYENEGNTLNFQSVIEYCRENISEFSKASLKARKLEASDDAEEWINDYLANAYEPTAEDFDALARVVRQNSKRMRSIYTTVASTIFAHAVHVDYPVVEEIMKDLNFSEMEKGLDSIWHAYNQIWQMYENGRKPELDVVEYPYRHEVTESVAKQIGCECKQA